MHSKRETRSNKHKPREHCMSYSWWILMIADRNCSKTVPPNKYMAHIFCLLDLKDDTLFSSLNILYATYRLTGSYCCSLDKNLASECDEVLGSAALEEAYAGQVEPALKIILDLEIQPSLHCLT